MMLFSVAISENFIMNEGEVLTIDLSRDEPKNHSGLRDDILLPSASLFIGTLTFPTNGTFLFSVIPTVSSISYTLLVRFGAPAQEYLCAPLTLCFLCDPCIVKAKPSNQKSLFGVKGSSYMRLDLCDPNVKVHVLIHNLDVFSNLQLSAFYTTISTPGLTKPCSLFDNSPGFAFTEPSFTSPIISDFQPDVSNRINVAPFLPTTLFVSWVAIGEIPSRIVRVWIKDESSGQVRWVAYSDSLLDSGYATVPLDASFQSSNRLKFCLWTEAPQIELFCSERFFIYAGKSLPSVSSTALRLSATTAMFSYSRANDKISVSFDPMETYLLRTSEVTPSRTMVLFSQRRNLIVISQRGTVGTVDDWNVNFDTSTTSCSLFVPGCIGQVTNGFGTEHKRNRDSVMQIISENGGHIISRQYTFIVTGHSQGAALATLTALDLVLNIRIPSSRVMLIVFGLPVIGDVAFASLLRSTFANNFEQIITRDQIGSQDSITLYSKYFYGSLTQTAFPIDYPALFADYNRSSLDDSCILLSQCPGILAECASCTSSFSTGNIDAHEPRNYLGAVIRDGLLDTATVSDPLPPYNDFCEGALEISAFPWQSVTIDLMLATSYLDVISPCGVTTRSIWFKFIAPADGSYTFDTCVQETTMANTVISLYEGQCNSFVFVDCNVGGCGSSAKITGLKLRAGTLYYVALSKLGTSDPLRGFSKVALQASFLRSSSIVIVSEAPVTTSAPSAPSSVPVAIIIGVVVGALVLIGVIVTVSIVLVRRRKAKAIVADVQMNPFHNANSLNSSETPLPEKR